MANITHAECGRVIIINRSVAEIPSGRIALCLMLDQGTTFGLIYERGGDWMVFGDADRHDSDSLAGWEPAAVREAVASAISAAPEAEEDLDWYLEWANDAEKALASVWMVEQNVAGNWEPVPAGDFQTKAGAETGMQSLVSDCGYDADTLRVEHYTGARAEAYGA